MKERIVILLLSVFACTFSNIFTYHVTDSESHSYPNGTCKKYYWRCEDGPCIKELRYCDGFEDCTDGSDETDCDDRPTCNLDTNYQCHSGECIDREMLCDDAPNCFSEDDEENCGSENTQVCPKDRFRCDNGRCIPQKWVCDGRNDCQGGIDEKNCSKPCPRGYSPCNSSACIPLTLVCDGNEDCSQGEDEQGCSTNTKSMCSTERGLYLCKDKSKCLKSEWVCDSSPHCDDGSDENADCGTHCNGMHCEHVCFRTPDGPKCTCKTGYKLSRDNSTCQDINECEIENQVCDHFCKNTVGDVGCSCGEGYRLLDDGATCRIKDPALLLFSVGNNVEAQMLDGSRSWIVSKGSKEAFGVALDPITNNVYWIENRERVLFKHLDKREEPKVFIHQGLELPENLVIDWFGRNIYIADYKRNQILACNLESEDCVPILENLNKPRAVQLDLHNRYLYWTAIESHTIERAGLDGSNRETVIREDIVWPNGLAIDHPASRIYWVDARLNKIDSCNLDGQKRKSLLHEDAYHAYSLAVWQDRIYWTEWQKEEDLHMEIHSCRKRDGKFWRSEYKDEKRAVNNIAIYHKSMFINSVNPCHRPFGSKCSHLCLLSPIESRGYVCACPIEMTLDEHGHTCHEKESKIPLVAVQSKLYGVPFRHYGASNPQLRKYARLDLGVVADMDYNPHKDTVYFADPRNELISSVNLSNRKVERLIENIKRPISVAIDWLRDNLYWINGFHHTVEVSRSSGHYRRTVIKHFQNPTDLALDVISGYLFVSVASIAPAIMKCDLNGSSCVNLAYEGILNPSSIFLDVTVEPKMLYWTDSEKNTIETISVNGSNQRVVFKNLTHPMKVHVDDEHILWSELRSTFLYVAEKTENGAVKEINMELENIPAGEWFLTLTMVGGPKIATKSNPCFGLNKCHQLCFSQTDSAQVCSCANGLALSEDGSTCSYEKCPFNQSQCANKECIPAMYWCDGTADCEDNSDEVNCTSRSCTENEFECNDGQCIHYDYKCDGMNDCSDESDEDESLCGIKNCTHSGEWQCESGQCIPLSWRCNGKEQCSDGSDEKNCPSVVCPSDRRKCDDGYCIPHSWFCDGQRDCNDGTDEQECPCKLGEYRCKNGSCLDEGKLCSGILSCGSEKMNLQCMPNSTYSQTVSKQHCDINFIPCNATISDVQCIPFEAWCNGTVECLNQEDETNCHVSCKEDEARCMDNSCIPQGWVCDGQHDCLDESDEKNCYKTTVKETPETVCSDTEFECYDRTCIKNELVCDQTPNCAGGEDEYGDCDKCSTGNGGCEQICTSNPNGVICSCKDGFKLNSNGYSCDDIDECEDIEICDHFCVNMKGTFSCTCEANYTIGEDGITCKRTDGSQWSLITINNNNLINLKGNLERIGSQPLLLPGKLHAENTKFLYDPVERRRIAIEAKTGTIHKENQEHPGNWISEKTNISNIMATSLDYINRNIYLVQTNIYQGKETQSGKILPGSSTTVKVYNIKSKTSGTLFDNEKIITAMELSLEFRNMFTCENEKHGGSIVKRNLDGSLPRELASKKVLMCQSLAFDALKKRVYWVDGILNTIESIGSLGHARRRYSSRKVSVPRGLALMGRSLVWFNSNQSVLMKCSLRKPEECTEVSYDSHVAILSIMPAYDMNIPSACKNSHCPHICVQSTRSIPHCMCNHGYVYKNGKCYPAFSNYQQNKISGDCVDNPCVAGTCEYLSLGFIHCKCPEGFEGRLCEVSAAESTQDRSNQVIITLVIFFTIMAIIFGFVCCYKRKPGKFFNKNRFRFDPSFVLMRDESSEPPTPPVIRFNTATNTNSERLSYENSNDSAIVIDPSNSLNEPLHDVSLSSPTTVVTSQMTPSNPLVTPRGPKKVEYSPFHP